MQLGSQACDEDRFRRHIEYGIAHNAYYIGMGDYVDVASPSNRAKLKAAELYDSVQDALEAQAQEHVNRFLHLTRGTEGRWLGLLSGHHYFDWRSGQTSDTKIAEGLRATYLGDCAFLRVGFDRLNRGSPNINTTFWLHHGQGGGGKAGAPLNKLENLMHSFDADIYLIGHMHKKVAAPIDQLYMTRQAPFRLGHKTKMIACTGSFLKGYMEGSTNGLRAAGGYVEKRMLTPVSLGGIGLRLRPQRDTNSAPAHVSIKVEL